MVGYLTTWNFRDTFISQFGGAHIFRHLNSAILLKFCILNHFTSNFWVTQNLFPRQCYLHMSLNLVNWLYQRYNNVKSNKNAMAVLYVNSNIMYYVPDTYLFASLSFRVFFFSLNRENRNINVSRKFQVGPITTELLASTTQATLFNT